MTTNSSFRAKFWGVRGSVPAPISNAEIEKKILNCVEQAIGEIDPDAQWEDIVEWLHTKVAFANRATYGGNTTCVEVRCGNELIILDMGTGLRELGQSLLPETFENGGLSGTILQSHVHWDHIQGYPFWPHLYMPRSMLQNMFAFYGGREWDKSLEEVLRGQMNPPVFPIEHRELEQTALQMQFHTVHDGMEIVLGHNSVAITCRKLNHPQETYGYRIRHDDRVLAYCTDHEPYAGSEPHRPLLQLAEGVDILITDCQFSLDEYNGAGGGVQKMGWGHSYPEYIAEVARRAGVKQVITTHHDPQASDEHIEELAESIESLSGIPTRAAYEGLSLEL